MTPQQKREQADRVQQATGLARARASLEARIAHYEQLRQAADTAWQDHNNEIHRIQNEQAKLRMAVAARGTATGDDGRPERGPSGAEQAAYDRLVAEDAQERERYEAWVSDARLPETDWGGLDTSWSRRNPTSLATRIDRLRVEWGALGARIDELGLSPGERAAAGLPAPEYTEHVERTESLRLRLG